MKKRFFVIAVAALVVAAIALVGCTPDEPQQEYSFVVPDGAPALGIVGILAGDGVEGMKSPEIVPSNTISTRAVQADIAVVPANLAANLYNKGQDVVMVGTVTHGNLFVLGVNTQVASLQDLEGKLVCSIGQNSVPDYVFRTLLADAGLEIETGDVAQEGKVTIKYYQDGSAVVQQLIQAKNGGNELIGVLAEPAVTNAKAKGVSELFDLQELWQDYTDSDTAGYAQAVLIVKKAVAEDTAFMERLVAALRENADYVLQNSADVASVIAEAYPQSAFAGQTFGTETLERCNCYFESAQQGKAGFEAMLNAIIAINAQAVGGKLPDAAFYFGG